MEVEEEKITTTTTTTTRLEERQRGLPWVEKYRPASMDDLLGHEDITRTIIHLIDSGTMPHLLLYGPPGTGKTSTILAAARKLYGTTFSTMVLEVKKHITITLTPIQIFQITFYFLRTHIYSLTHPMKEVSKLSETKSRTLQGAGCGRKA